MTDEYEVSFVIPYDEALKLASAYKEERNVDAVKFADYYFNSKCRIRHFEEDIPSIVTMKEGDKASGHRKEIEDLITIKDPCWLDSVAKLKVVKTRYESELKNIKISIDVVESPLKVGILELETSDKEASKVIFKASEEAIDCPLNAWDYFKRRVAFVGGPSSGKTSTAKAISLILNNEYGGNTSDVVEYATSFIQKMGHPPTFEDQSWIQLKQKEREEAVASTANMVFSDCPPFLSYIYAARALHEKRSYSRSSDYTMQSLYKRAVRSLSDYKLFVLMETLEYKENNVRFHNEKQSREIYEAIKKFIVEHGREKDLLHVSYKDKEAILNNILYMNKYQNAVSVASKVEQLL